MKAEIGFVPRTERLRLTLSAQSSSETTLVSMFADRMGLTEPVGLHEDGVLYVDEPAAPATAPQRVDPYRPGTLSDERVAEWAGGRPSNPITSDGVHMALELQWLRVARAAVSLDEDDLTPDQLEALEYHGCSSGTPTPPMVRGAIILAVAEIRRRRNRKEAGNGETVIARMRVAIGDLADLVDAAIGDSAMSSQTYARMKSRVNELRAVGRLTAADVGAEFGPNSPKLPEEGG